MWTLGISSIALISLFSSLAPDSSRGVQAFRFQEGLFHTNLIWVFFTLQLSRHEKEQANTSVSLSFINSLLEWSTTQGRTATHLPHAVSSTCCLPRTATFVLDRALIAYSVGQAASAAAR